MTQLLKRLSVTFALMSVLSTFAFAQSDDAKVFYLYVRIDETLIDSKKVETTSDRSVLTGYSDRVIVSEELLDTVRLVTAQMVSKKLGVETEMFYLKDKKGREISTKSMNIFPGMPFSNLNRVRKVDDSKYYVKVYVDITPWEKVSTKGKVGPSQQRPKVDLRFDVFDNNGKKYFSNRVVLKDFDALTSFSRIDDTVKVTESEVLSAEHIVGMYILALQTALADE